MKTAPFDETAKRWAKAMSDRYTGILRKSPEVDMEPIAVNLVLVDDTSAIDSDALDRIGSIKIDTKYSTIPAPAKTIPNPDYDSK